MDDNLFSQIIDSSSEMLFDLTDTKLKLEQPSRLVDIGTALSQFKARANTGVAPNVS